MIGSSQRNDPFYLTDRDNKLTDRDNKQLIITNRKQFETKTNNRILNKH